MINQEQLLYASWPFLGGIVSLFNVGYVWQRRRDSRLARTFIVLVMGVAFWSIGYAFELLGMSVPVKLFWARVQYGGVATIGPLWFILSLQTTGHDRWLTRRRLALLAIIPIFTLIAVWTNDYHGLHYLSATLNYDQTTFPILALEYGPTFWVNWVYAYGLLSVTAVLHVRQAIRSVGLYRWQSLMQITITVLPVVGNLIYVTGHSPLRYLDLTVLGLVMAIVIVTWGLFGVRFIDIVPAARETVLENMLDAVFVVDGRNRIVDANPAAGRLLDRSMAQLVGESITGLPVTRPDMAERLATQAEGHALVILDLPGKERQFELRVSPLRDRGVAAGRILTLSDITERQAVAEALVRNEARLRSLFESLNDLVFVVDEQGYFTEFHVPAGWLALAPPEDYLGRLYYQALPEETAIRLRAGLERTQRTGQPQQVEYTLDMGGGLVWFSALISPVRDEAMQPRGTMIVARDISDLKQAEAGLKTSEERYRLLFDTAFEAMLLSQSAEVINANAAFEILFGYTRREVIGMPVVIFAAEDSREQVTHLILDNIEEPHEAVMQRRDGSTFPAEVRGKTLIIQGQTYRVTAIRDLTVRRRLEFIEQERRVLAEAFRDTAAALNSTLELNAVLDRIMDNVEQVVPYDAMNIMLFEEGVADIVRARGYEARGFTSRELALRITALDLLNFQQMAKSGQPVAIPDVSLYPGWVPREQIAWVRSYAGAPIIVEGTLIGFLNVDSATRGFYRQSHAERLQAFADQAGAAIQNARLYEATRQHNRKLELINQITQIGTATLDLRELLDLLADRAAWVIGGDGCYITLWDAERRQVIDGAASAAVRHLYPTVTQSAEPGEKTLIESALAAGQPLPIDDVRDSPYLSRRMAEQFPGRSVLALPLRAADKDIGALLLVFDKPHPFTPGEMVWAGQAADLIALAIARTQSYVELQERNRELDAFSHTVAHDLKSPLHGVMNYVELVQLAHKDALPGDADELLDEALAFTEKMNQIIESLLLMATTRRTEVQTEAVDVQAVAEAALTRFKRQIKTRGIRVTLAEDLPNAMGYGPWLEEVFANLIGNAIKYIGIDNPQPEIGISYTRMADAVRYEVSDNGIGLTLDQQKQVFEMLSRFHNHEAAGSGLGLSIVERIITRLGGLVGVESEPGRGSTFWFALQAAGEREKRKVKSGKG